MGRLAKIQIVIAGIATLIYLALRSGAFVASNRGLPEALEALSFILCAVAVASSGKGLRIRYRQLGSDKQIARESDEYMRMRESVRWWSYLAAVIIAALAAARFNLSVWMVVVIVAVALPPFMILADRASGWRRVPQSSSS